MQGNRGTDREDREVWRSSVETGLAQTIQAGNVWPLREPPLMTRRLSKHCRGSGSFPVTSLMLLVIDNGLDRSVASLSLLLSQAMPLYLDKTESNKYFQEFSLGGSDLKIPTGSEAWSTRRVTEAVRSWCFFAYKYVTEMGTTCKYPCSFQTHSLPKLSLSSQHKLSPQHKHDPKLFSFPAGHLSCDQH